MEEAKERQREEKEQLENAEEFVRHPDNWQRKVVVGQSQGFFGGTT
jgi:hypothetical protein